MHIFFLTRDSLCCIFALASGKSRIASQGEDLILITSRFFYLYQHPLLMNFLYIDEAGTSHVNDASTHFVLAGLMIPCRCWNTCDEEINRIKTKYHLENTEIHTAWILRNYHEQELIANFDKLTYQQRRNEVDTLRKKRLFKLKSDPKLSHRASQEKKNYEHTKPYIHLTKDERRAYIKELVICVGGWGFARLFAECVDKAHWHSSPLFKTIDEQAFTQIITRFERYLQILDSQTPGKNYGLIIHDNNLTIEKKHTQLMKDFRKNGTLWTNVSNILETPLFVNSELTSMIQVADLCCYFLRRYVEKEEIEMFDEIIKRADTKDGIMVGVRHFTSASCKCFICENHRKKPIVISPVPPSTPS